MLTEACKARTGIRIKCVRRVWDANGAIRICNTGFAKCVSTTEPIETRVRKSWFRGATRLHACETLALDRRMSESAIFGVFHVITCTLSLVRQPATLSQGMGKLISCVHF